MSKSRTGVLVRLLDPGEGKTLQAVIALGDQHKRTLGLIPRAAFADYAERQRILVAKIDGVLAGYALFDLPANRIRLAQLCVEPQQRHSGVALKLVETLSAMHAERLGIAVRCRRDWPAADVWPRLGFEPRSNAPGRSAAGHLVTSWWRDHGHPDLFNQALADEDSTIVALDSNVFRDLHEGDRPESAESRALVSDWLAGSIELVVSPALKAELNDIADPPRRELLLRAAATYRTVRTPDLSAVRQTTDELLRHVDATSLAKDRSLRNDARLVAEALIGGADAFVTRDEAAIAAFSGRSDLLGALWMSTPADFIVHLDELREAANYRPAELLSTGYSVTEASSTDEQRLHVLVSHGVGENRRGFIRRVRTAASGVGHYGSRRILLDPAGGVSGAFFFTWSGDVLDISLLRTVDQKLPRTIANQLVLLARKEARSRQTSRIVVTDPGITRTTEAVLRDNGFSNKTGDRLTCAVVEGCFPWTVARERLRRYEWAEELPADVPTPRVAADVERAAWPLKIVDAEIPCFLVPIRPAPAAELLGYRSMLFERDSGLGLSREHVYYRAPSPLVVSAPGRILWYVSGNQKEVVAASRLDQVEVAHPGRLHRKYKRFGVLERSVIDRSARGGVAAALLFSDTELFRNPVGLKRLRSIDSDGGLEPLASPRSITGANFFSVYSEGDPR